MSLFAAVNEIYGQYFGAAAATEGTGISCQGNNSRKRIA